MIWQDSLINIVGCTRCGGILDRASAFVPPGEGPILPQDVTVCFHCGAFLRVDREYGLISVTDREEALMRAFRPYAYRRLQRLQSDIRYYRDQQERRKREESRIFMDTAPSST